jgi:transposase InsO family protein
VSDSEILELSRKVLKESPFLGEGHRKIHAMLRFQGVTVGRDRLLRILRENDLLAQPQSQREMGPRNHDGAIQTDQPDAMWGTDLTFTMTEEDGVVPVFICVDHFNTECLGLHANLKANRFEAMEPIRQAIKARFGTFSKDIARGLKLRHDHGSQYISHFFQREISFLGIESSPSFVRSPEGNGVSERFIRTLKEQLLWIRRFTNIQELQTALQEFKNTFNTHWRLGRHGYLSPQQVHQNFLAARTAA